MKLGFARWLRRRPAARRSGHQVRGGWSVARGRGHDRPAFERVRGRAAERPGRLPGERSSDGDARHHHQLAAGEALRGARFTSGRGWWWPRARDRDEVRARSEARLLLLLRPGVAGSPGSDEPRGQQRAGSESRPKRHDFWCPPNPQCGRRYGTGGTMRTARSALWTTPYETLPSSIDLTPERPRLPSTISSVFSSSAASRTARHGHCCALGGSGDRAGGEIARRIRLR
jgi:hypothetical protein